MNGNITCKTTFTGFAAGPFGFALTLPGKQSSQLVSFLLGSALLLAFFRAGAAIHYASLNSPNPTAPYTNWETAATVIQQAVDAAQNGDRVLVTNGVYDTGSRAVNADGVSRVVVNKSLSL